MTNHLLLIGTILIVLGIITAALAVGLGHVDEAFEQPLSDEFWAAWIYALAFGGTGFLSLNLAAITHLLGY